MPSPPRYDPTSLCPHRARCPLVASESGRRLAVPLSYMTYLPTGALRRVRRGRGDRGGAAGVHVSGQAGARRERPDLGWVVRTV